MRRHPYTTKCCVCPISTTNMLLADCYNVRGSSRLLLDLHGMDTNSYEKRLCFVCILQSNAWSLEQRLEVTN